MVKQLPVLVSPDGQEYRPGDRAEDVRLRARGYTVKSAPAVKNKAAVPEGDKSGTAEK